MQFDFDAILVSLFSVATISGAVAWIIKSVSTKVLDAGIEKYKQSLAQETERHKAQLTLTHELFLKEHAPRFQILAERRADVIRELYSSLLHAAMALDSDYSGQGIYRVTGGSAEELERLGNEVRQAHETRHQEAQEAIQAFAVYFFENRIFFSASLCEHVDKFLELMQRIYDKLEYSDWYRREKRHPSWPDDNVTVEVWNAAADQANETRIAIENEFRTLLGVSAVKLRSGIEAYPS